MSGAKAMRKRSILITVPLSLKALNGRYKVVLLGSVLQSCNVKATQLRSITSIGVSLMLESAK